MKPFNINGLNKKAQHVPVHIDRGLSFYVKLFNSISFISISYKKNIHEKGKFSLSRTQFIFICIEHVKT